MTSVTQVSQQLEPEPEAEPCSGPRGRSAWGRAQRANAQHLAPRAAMAAAFGMFQTPEPPARDPNEMCIDSCSDEEVVAAGGVATASATAPPPPAAAAGDPNEISLSDDDDE